MLGLRCHAKCVQARSLSIRLFRRHLISMARTIRTFPEAVVKAKAKAKGKVKATAKPRGRPRKNPPVIRRTKSQVAKDSDHLKSSNRLLQSSRAKMARYTKCEHCHKQTCVAKAKPMSEKALATIQQFWGFHTDQDKRMEQLAMFLESYMVFREVLRLRPGYGHEGHVMSVRKIVVQKQGGGFDKQRAQAMMTWAHKIVGPVEYPNGMRACLQHLAEDPGLNVMTMLTMEQLHGIVPEDHEVMQMLGVSREAFIKNAFLLGRLRSTDYNAWVRQFHEHSKRWPFDWPSDSEQGTLSDAMVFRRSYHVPMGRVSVPTRETLLLRGMRTQLRNWELAREIVNESDQLINALDAPDLRRATEAIRDIAGIGDYIAKNVLVQVGLASEKCGVVCQWADELSNESVAETQVSGGPNGNAFARLGLFGALDETPGVDLHQFYCGLLGSFSGVEAVEVTLSDGEVVVVPVKAVWMKGWVKQLNACKAVIVLKAAALGIIRCPRREEAVSRDVQFCFDWI